MVQRKKTAKKLGPRALVVGISDYPVPIPKLPCVSADVREIAKLLGSKTGTFSARNIKVLRDGEATRTNLLTALKQTLAGARPNDTVFVYLAGHGGIANGDYYFVPHDTDARTLATTGLPLTQIRDLFDQSPSHQVFLWLDFCHSGGILARSSGKCDDREIISRALGVVQGKGKVILAACTESQESWEDPRIGHGLFTDALLRGLKGEAEAGGEVTANSLFDFIDREVGSLRQRPMFFGKLTGRIVLMNSKRGMGTTKTPPTKALAKKPHSKRLKSTTGRATGTWVMLDRSFFIARSVQQGEDGAFTLRIAPATTDEEAELETLRTRRGGDSLPFAARNDAHLVRVGGCEKDLSGKRTIWKLTLAVEERGFGGSWTEATYNDGSNVYTPEDVARLRVRLLLLDEQPPGASGPGHSGYSLVAGAVAGSGMHQVRESVIRSTYARHRKSPSWREMARLQAIFLLKATGTVDHVLRLTIGPMRGGKVAVAFRGRRPARYTGQEPVQIEVSGTCTVK